MLQYKEVYFEKEWNFFYRILRLRITVRLIFEIHLQRTRCTASLKSSLKLIGFRLTPRVNELIDLFFNSLLMR